MKCPLCTSTDLVAVHRDQRRDYVRCETCLMIFVPPSQRLTSSAERAVYEQHQNNPSDIAYRQFLNRLFEPLQAVLVPGSEGLDFGSGPGPTLSVMFTEAGFPMRLYDVFYANDQTVLSKTYDFITATEVIEHLYEPGRELKQLWSLLKPGGWLGIMTKRIPMQPAFADWYYIRDPTHVCFFAEQSFQWLATEWNAQIEFIGDDVVLLRKDVEVILDYQ